MWLKANFNREQAHVEVMVNRDLKSGKLDQIELSDAQALLLANDLIRTVLHAGRV